MSTLRKRFILLAVSLLGCIFATSCEKKHSTTMKTLTLTYWGSAGELKALKENIKGFEKNILSL